VTVIMLNGVPERFLEEVSMCVIKKGGLGKSSFKLAVFNKNKLVAVITASTHINFRLRDLDNVDVSDMGVWTKWLRCIKNCGFNKFDEFHDFLNSNYDQKDKLRLVRFNRIWTYDELVKQAMVLDWNHAKNLHHDNKKVMCELAEKAKMSNEHQLVLSEEDVRHECVGKISIK